MPLHLYGNILPLALISLILINMLEISLVSVGLVVLTQFVKNFIKPRFGDTGVHVFIFLVGFGIVSVQGFMTQYPPFGEMVKTAGVYLVGALAVYQVIWKQLSDKLNLGL